jgi:anti-sigma regulatory factor (Ser/Thr protein kinase)
MSDLLTIPVRNDLAELERVASLIEDFGRRHRLPTRTVFELNLAIDEVLTNIILYAFLDAVEHEIVLRLSAVAAGETVVVEIEDDGQPFDPTCCAPPDLTQAIDDRPVGGLGIHLVRRLMDSLTYRRRRDKNLLAMRKFVRDKVQSSD